VLYATIFEPTICTTKQCGRAKKQRVINTVLQDEELQKLINKLKNDKW